MAEAGWSVLGIDSRLVGGECPYYGCIPSKMIIRGAEVLTDTQVRHTWPYGAGDAGVRRRWRSGSATRRPTTGTTGWRRAVREPRRTFSCAAWPGWPPARTTARSGRGGRHDLTQARHVVVGVGTAPAMPPIEGLPTWSAASTAGVDEPRGYAVTDRAGQPGGARRGKRSASGQPGSGFGSVRRCAVVEASDRILRVEEPEASAAVAEVLAHEGLELHTNVRATGVSAGGEGVLVTLNDGSTVTARSCSSRWTAAEHAGPPARHARREGDAHTLDVDDGMRVLHDASRSTPYSVATRPGARVHPRGGVAGPGAHRPAVATR